MSFRFRLRPFFVALTTVAVCLGTNLGVHRILGFPAGQFDRIWLAAHTLARLPFYLVFAVGGVIVFERRHSCPLSSRLALIGITTAVLWDIVSPWADMTLKTAIVNFKLPTYDSIRLIDISWGVCESIVYAVSWGLVMVAFLLAQKRVTEVHEGLPKSSN